MYTWRKFLFVFHTVILLITACVIFSLFYFNNLTDTQAVSEVTNKLETKHNNNYIKAQKVDIKLTYIDGQPSKILLSTDNGRKFWVKDKSFFPNASDNSELTAILDSTLTHFITKEYYELEGVFYKEGKPVTLENPKEVIYAEYAKQAVEGANEVVNTTVTKPISEAIIYLLAFIVLLNLLLMLMLSVVFSREETISE